MDEHPLFKQRAAGYILDRVCPGGGFCFYRLDEPNPHDTYYALAALQLLGVPFDDGGSTVRWLCRVQQDSGAFASLPQAFFVLLSLKLLGSQPQRDPADSIALFASRLTAALRSQAYLSTTLLQTLHQLAELRRALRLGNGRRRSAPASRRLCLPASSRTAASAPCRTPGWPPLSCTASAKVRRT